MGLRFDVVTLFPKMVADAASYGVTGKAIEQKRVSLNTWNPRDYAPDRYKTVDDRPFGGGPGMVMKCEPLLTAVRAAQLQNAAGESLVICLSPQGKPLNQATLIKAAAYAQLILVAGRYEGIDERFVTQVCDEEWSLGDFVISGGELAALVVVDAVTRLIAGVLGHPDSAVEDSFMQGLLDCPHYTRPEHSPLGEVPAVLLSGDHAEIDRWRRKQALGRTWLKRPDLLSKTQLSVEQQSLLNEFAAELKLESGNHE